MRGYPPDTVVAEKFESLVTLGMKNTRMKDFFDLWHITKSQALTASGLHQAIAATFKARGTPIPSQPPLAFTPDFTRDEAKQRIWQAFLARSRLEAPASLYEVMLDVAALLLPVMKDAGKPSRNWHPGGPWQDRGDQ